LQVIENVQKELDQFGLCIYNANVKELQDTPGSEYFAFLSRKAHEGASNQAKVDVAEARMRGEIGEAAKKGHTKQEIAKIDAETAILETQRKGDKAQADAELTNRQTELNMGIKLKQIEAGRATEVRDIELQKEVETRKAETELERLRAKDLVKSKIARETVQQESDAKLYQEMKAADGQNYLLQQEADANYYREVKAAEARLFAKQKDAEGCYLQELKGADASCYAMRKKTEAIREQVDVLGGTQAWLQYMMIKENVYEKLALANAKAINGLQPKITIWNTGEGSADSAAAPIRNIMQSLPPLLSTINEQTGIAPPSWLATMPNNGVVKDEPE
jgi:flotillin